MIGALSASPLHCGPRNQRPYAIYSDVLDGSLCHRPVLWSLESLTSSWLLHIPPSHQPHPQPSSPHWQKGTGAPNDSNTSSQTLHTRHVPGNTAHELLNLHEKPWSWYHCEPHSQMMTWRLERISLCPKSPSMGQDLRPDCLLSQPTLLIIRLHNKLYEMILESVWKDNCERKAMRYLVKKT